MSFLFTWLPFEVFEKRLTKNEKKEVEEKRISILPKPITTQNKELQENMIKNVKKTEEINNKSENKKVKDERIKKLNEENHIEDIKKMQVEAGMIPESYQNRI